MDGKVIIYLSLLKQKYLGEGRSAASQLWSPPLSCIFSPLFPYMGVVTMLQPDIQTYKEVLKVKNEVLPTSSPMVWWIEQPNY